MTSDPSPAAARTEPVPPFPPDNSPAAVADPLAKVTLTPRAFVALLAALGLLLGLLMAVLPVHVAAPDPAHPATVSCGNTIGGAEPATIAANLGQPDRPTMVNYIGMCESAISTRTVLSWPLFLAAALTIVYLGTVRRDRR